MNTKREYVCLVAGVALMLSACSDDAKPLSAAVAGNAGVTAGTGGGGAAGGGAAGAGRGATQSAGTSAPSVAGASGQAGVGPSAGRGVAGSTSAGSAAGAGSSGMSGISGAAGASAASGGDAGASGASAGSSGAAAGVGGAGGAVAEACSGKPGAKRGKSSQRVMTGPGARTFVHYAPQGLDANKPVPLLIVPHGYTQSGQDMYDITKYASIADREGFVVMFPDGDPGSVGPWEVGSGVCGNGAFVPGSGDDQAFVDGMIAFASADQCIDKDHIFMSGWSMGGYFSHHSGCLRSDIRAIGPHSAGTHDLGNCKNQRKPVIMFHFDPDGLIAYSCGQRARDGWIERNGCQAASPEVKTVKGGKCEYYKGCPSDAQVAFCTFDIPPNHTRDFLAGHAWSGGTVHSYSIAETESAAELGWSFFKTYAW